MCLNIGQVPTNSIAAKKSSGLLPCHFCFIFILQHLCYTLMKCRRIKGVLTVVEYQLKRSRRKTMAVEITREGQVVVRAPLRLPLVQIERFLEEKNSWIAKHQETQRQRRLAYPEPTPEELETMAQQAQQLIPQRVEHYANLMGLSPAAVTITAARTRFGSCSFQNRLCFSCRLMAYPPEAIDYVVVHELAHILHKNHGSEFYALIERVLPDYRDRRALRSR